MRQIPELCGNSVKTQDSRTKVMTPDSKKFPRQNTRPNLAVNPLQFAILNLG